MVRRSLCRPRNLKVGETRSPMHRFLQETVDGGDAEPSYYQQYRTMWKAYRLGYITEGLGEGHCGEITAEGRRELIRLGKEA